MAFRRRKFTRRRRRGSVSYRKKRASRLRIGVRM